MHCRHIFLLTFILFTYFYTSTDAEGEEAVVGETKVPLSSSSDDSEECPKRNRAAVLQTIVLLDVSPENLIDFQQQKERVTKILRNIERFSTGRKRFYELITFHRAPTDKLQSANIDEITEQINGLTMISTHETSPAKALNEARAIVEKMPQAQSVILLVHDGHNTDLSSETLSASARLSKLKASIFAIAGGKTPPALAKLAEYTGERRRVFAFEQDNEQFLEALDEEIEFCPLPSAQQTEKNAAKEKTDAAAVEQPAVLVPERPIIQKIELKKPVEIVRKQVGKSNGAVKFECGTHSEKVDLVLLLDTSGSIYHTFGNEVALVKSLLSELQKPIEAKMVRVSLISFAEKPSMAFSLDDPLNATQMIGRVDDQVHFTGGVTKICDAIEMGQKEMEKFGRNGALKVFVLISDGHGHELWPRTSDIGKNLRQQNMQKFAVSMSSDYSKDELMAYIGETNRIFVGFRQNLFEPTLLAFINECLAHSSSSTAENNDATSETAEPTKTSEKTNTTDEAKAATESADVGEKATESANVEAKATETANVEAKATETANVNAPSSDGEAQTKDEAEKKEATESSAGSTIQTEQQSNVTEEATTISAVLTEETKTTEVTADHPSSVTVEPTSVDETNQQTTNVTSDQTTFVNLPVEQQQISINSTDLAQTAHQVSTDHGITEKSNDQTNATSSAQSSGQSSADQATSEKSDDRTNATSSAQSSGQASADQATPEKSDDRTNATSSAQIADLATNATSSAQIPDHANADQTKPEKSDDNTNATSSAQIADQGTQQKSDDNTNATSSAQIVDQATLVKSDEQTNATSSAQITDQATLVKSDEQTNATSSAQIADQATLVKSDEQTNATSSAQIVDQATLVKSDEQTNATSSAQIVDQATLVKSDEQTNATSSAKTGDQASDGQPIQEKSGDNTNSTSSTQTGDQTNVDQKAPEKSVGQINATSNTDQKNATESGLPEMQNVDDESKLKMMIMSSLASKSNGPQITAKSAANSTKSEATDQQDVTRANSSAQAQQQQQPKNPALPAVDVVIERPQQDGAQLPFPKSV